MPEVFTKAKRSQVMSRIRSRGNKDTELALIWLRWASELPEIEFVARDAEVFDDVGNDAARHVARMPGERDQAVGLEGVGLVPVTAGSAQEFAADCSQTALKLPAVPRGISAHKSGGEDKLVAEGGRDGTPGFEERFQMHLGRLLKPEGGFAPIAPVRVTTGQEAAFGNPDTVFVLTKLHFRKWNDHNAAMVARRLSGVKGPLHA